MNRIEVALCSGKKLFGTHSHKGALGIAVAALSALLFVSATRADDNGAAGGTGQAGAARLSSVEGQVRLMQGGQVLADPALQNAPLFAGTQIQTGDDGKAEIQFDDGSIARVSPDSGLTIKSISGDGGQGTQIVLDGGLAYFELQGGENSQTQVIFGDSVTTASGFTVMRIRMDTPPGELAVFSGNAHLERGNSLAIDLHGGESVQLDAQDPNRYNLAESIEPDSWDEWNQDRDQALSAAAADQTGAAGNFINNETPNPAWNDLDANGNWYNVPGQGYVWSPFEASAAGWDPYGCGHWMWTPRWGYIWVSCESWGYLPFQCGAWSFYNGFGWGWSPGLGVGFGGGCNPWWRRGGGYVGLNIGFAPGWYHPIQRPIVRRPPVGWKPAPVIAVNRRPLNQTGTLPARARNASVEIGGHVVQPMRPLPANQGYVRSESGYVYHPAMGYQAGSKNGAQSGGVPVYGESGVQGNFSTHPGYVVEHPGNRQGYTYNQQAPGQGFIRNNQGSPQPGQYRPQPARTYSPSNQGQQNHTYTPPASHGSSGGYSGGGGHPSGGFSGGGGGGASRSGGGGGGGGGGGSHGGGGGGSAGGGGGGHH